MRDYAQSMGAVCKPFDEMLWNSRRSLSGVGVMQIIVNQYSVNVNRERVYGKQGYHSGLCPQA